MMMMMMMTAMTAAVVVFITVSDVPQRDKHVCNFGRAERILGSPESSRVLLGDCPVLPHFSYPGMCSVICKIQNGTVQRHFLSEEGQCVHSAENQLVLLITFVYRKLLLRFLARSEQNRRQFGDIPSLLNCLTDLVKFGSAVYTERCRSHFVFVRISM